MKCKRLVAGASMLMMFILGLSGCAGAPTRGGTVSAQAQSATQQTTLTVFAAASLTDVFKELAQTFEAQHPGITVRFSFGGSSAILAQILQGAPADVFASADEAKMVTAQQKGVVKSSAIFARNKLIVVVPKANPAQIARFDDVAKRGIRLVLAQDGVPIAEYTKQVLQKAAATHGTAWRDQVLANLASREADVRASVNRVVLGDADATFCYVTDVTPAIRDRVTIIPIPDDLNIQAAYPIGVVKSTSQPALAQQWIDFVLGNAGQQTMHKWGFQ